MSTLAFLALTLGVPLLLDGGVGALILLIRWLSGRR